MPKFPGFIGNSDKGQSVTADPELTMNWYFEPLPRFGANTGALYPCPGTQTFTTVPDLGTRGFGVASARVFVVVGATLYELFTDGSKTNRGTVVQDSNQATISYNGPTGQQLFITSGGNGYVYNLLTNVLTLELTGEATMGGFLDGYFLAFNIANSHVRLSALNDGTTWDPTQFFANSISADPWQAMVVANRQIWLIGQLTGQVWYDTGAFPQPFAPIPGAIFQFGTPAPFSVAVSGDTVLWLGQSVEGTDMVVAARGYLPQDVSTYAVANAIATYRDMGTIADAECLVYRERGHLFACFSFPQANATWVLDRQTNVWHQRDHWNAAKNLSEMWRPRVHAYAFNQHLVGDRNTGIIAAMDANFTTEADGSVIRRVRRAPGLEDESHRIKYARFQLYLEAGLGTVTGQGSDPVVMMRSSNDAGHTWGSERQASAGKIGQYGLRTYWNRCKLSRAKVFEVSVTDPNTAWRVVDAYLNNQGAARAQQAA